MGALNYVTKIQPVMDQDEIQKEVKLQSEMGIHVIAPRMYHALVCKDFDKFSNLFKEGKVPHETLESREKLRQKKDQPLFSPPYAFLYSDFIPSATWATENEFEDVRAAIKDTVNRMLEHNQTNQDMIHPENVKLYKDKTGKWHMKILDWGYENIHTKPLSQAEKLRQIYWMRMSIEKS